MVSVHVSEVRQELLADGFALLLTLAERQTERVVDDIDAELVSAHLQVRTQSRERAEGGREREREREARNEGRKDIERALETVSSKLESLERQHCGGHEGGMTTAVRPLALPGRRHWP